MPPVPFLTPPATSEDWQCRTLRTPTNKEWLGVFNSALLELTNSYNWMQVNPTDLTVDDAIAIVQEILIEFFATESCSGEGCLLPELDTPPFRIGVSGHFEFLDPSTGEWGAPTGEYEIPPTPEREETTPFDRRCAAAFNATNVLKLVYEAITDEIALGGDTLQVAAAMVAALVTAVGGWIAAPVYAIIQLSIALFAGIVEILQVLGGDVWTEDFDTQMRCALLECATSVGDVVEFDILCLKEQLWTEPNIADPDWFYDLQLFAQISYLIDIIGADGLNAAGATTGITVFDCDDCAPWCYEWSFVGSANTWQPRDNNAAYAVWNSGRWNGVAAGAGYQFGIERLFADQELTGVGFTYEFLSAPSGTWAIELYNNNTYVGGYVLTSPEKTVGVHSVVWGFQPTPMTADEVRFAGSSGGGQAGTSVRVTAGRLYGTGDNPFGEDNCE